jgi:hypothetical protein
MKTITLTDATALELQTALAAASTPTTTPPTTPPTTPSTTPPNVNLVVLPWGNTGLTSRAVARIPTNGSAAFKFTVPQGYSSAGKLLKFNVSPAGGNDYFPRGMVLSDRPGDFTGLALDSQGSAIRQQRDNSSSESVYMSFSVGGYPTRGILIKQPDKTNPDLGPGTYYFNVRQQDPSLSCQVDYAFRLP